MDDRLKKRIQQAKAMGYTDDQINAAISQHDQPVQQQPASKPTMAVEQAVQKPQDGFVKTAVKGLIKPAVDFGKLVAGTGFEVARAADSAMGNKNAYDVQKGAKNPFITREEFQKDYSTPTDTLLQTTKKTAGAGSYFVPGGAGVAGGIRAGAAAGGLYGLSQSEEKDIEGLATDTITGAGTGAVVGGVVGGVGKALGKMRGGGDSLRKGVIKPDVNPNPFMAEEEALIAKTVQKYGAKGSAESQKQQIPEIFRSITKDIQSKLSTSKGRVGTADATRFIDEALDNNINFDITNPVMLKARDKYVNQLLSLVNKSDDSLNIKPDGLFQYKQNLGKQLSNVFKKIDKGTPLNEKEEVAVTVWHTIDSLLTKAEPGVKELTLAQSYLYKAMPGIAKQSEASLSVPLVGKVPGSGVVQGAQDTIGRGMQAVGGIIDEVPQVVPQAINRAATMGAVDKAVSPQGMDINNAVQQSEQQVEPVPDISSAPQQEVPNGMDMSDEDMVVAMMQYDLQTTGGKNIPEIKSMYEIAAKGGGGGKLNATQQKRMGVLDQAEGIYYMVEDLALNAGTGLGAYGKANIGKLPGVEGGAEEDLGRVTSALAKGLAGALANEVGVATDRDIERWMGLMPKVTDTMDERKRVLKRLKDEVTRARQTIQNRQMDDTAEQSYITP